MAQLACDQGNHSLVKAGDSGYQKFTLVIETNYIRQPHPAGPDHLSDNPGKCVTILGNVCKVTTTAFQSCHGNTGALMIAGVYLTMTMLEIPSLVGKEFN